MAKLCPDCVYYNSSDTSCRKNSPYAIVGPKPSADVTFWPPVLTTDWCAEGYNDTDGVYDPQPQRLL